MAPGNAQDDIVKRLHGKRQLLRIATSAPAHRFEVVSMQSSDDEQLQFNDRKLATRANAGPVAKKEGLLIRWPGCTVHLQDSSEERKARGRPSITTDRQQPAASRGVANRTRHVKVQPLAAHPSGRVEGRPTTLFDGRVSSEEADDRALAEPQALVAFQFVYALGRLEEQECGRALQCSEQVIASRQSMIVLEIEEQTEAYVFLTLRRSVSFTTA